jgi:hypothetical protein
VVGCHPREKLFIDGVVRGIWLKATPALMIGEVTARVHL